MALRILARALAATPWTSTPCARPGAQICLTADDLAGLNYLYPSCDFVIAPPAKCYKSERNIGWLRFAMWVLLPVLIALLLLLCVVGCVKRHQAQKLGSFAVKASCLPPPPPSLPIRDSFAPRSSRLPRTRSSPLPRAISATYPPLSFFLAPRRMRPAASSVQGAATARTEARSYPHTRPHLLHRADGTHR